MRRLIGAATALLLALPATAQAEERISHFYSQVAIQPDASLEVTETIDINVENVRIEHGIFRDFPTRYKGPHGSQYRVGFTFEGATRDGQREHATTEPIPNGVRIKIGDADVPVPVGEHRYVIRYRTTRQVGRFKDFDELYWNATGNFWVFPIDVAEAAITLPAPVRFGQRSVYTGPQGSTGHAAEVTEEKPGAIGFRTTAPLAPYEGLTVAVAFPKGVIAEPPESSRLGWWLADYGPPLTGLIGLLALVGFYYLAWQRAGRNPRAGTVVPIFAPADDLTPAAMRFVWKMGADNRGFAAALVDLGVRGHVKLVENDGGWLSSTKRRIERLVTDAPAPDEELQMLNALVPAGESIDMEQKNHAAFEAARKALGASLKDNYEGRLFNRNWGWALGGLGVFAGCIWLAAAATVAATGTVPLLSVAVPFGAFVVFVLLAFALHGTAGVGKCLLLVAMAAALVVVAVLGLPIVGDALNSGWLLPIALPVLALPLVISAFWWIAAPTRAGRLVLDRILGFRQYLSITEGERLDRMAGAPSDTPQLFEKYLPFAIALGVENRWADRFAGMLAAAAAQGQQGFGWYAGGSSPWSNPSSFVDSVGSSLSSSVGTASAAPGSGGGGSSGGGGGGGGGGGW